MNEQEHEQYHIEALARAWASIVEGLSEIQLVLGCMDVEQFMLVDMEDGEQIKFGGSADSVCVIRTLGDEQFVVNATAFGWQESVDA